MKGPLVITLVPRQGEPLYTIFECTKAARTKVETCTTLNQALQRVKEIRAGA